MRVRIDLAYDGTDFSGWAAQPGRRTVEGQIRTALATLLREPIPSNALVVAGRTDAGVHARGQVAHVDLTPEQWHSLVRAEHTASSADSSEFDGLAAATLTSRLRGILAAQGDADISLRAITPAPEGFDARFSAIWRRYRYRICDDPAARDPLRRFDTVALTTPLDVAAMNEASATLLGLGDFAAFCKKREGATTVRTLLAYSWERNAPGVVEGSVIADAFCHSMVRALVGAIVPVGQGKAPTDWPAQVLAARVRDSRVKVMPAHGLTLEEVGYPPDAELAQRALDSRARREPLPE